MKNGAYISVKVPRQKAEKVRKLMRSATPEQAIEQIMDKILYAEKMERQQKKYKGKAQLKKVDE